MSNTSGNKVPLVDLRDVVKAYETPAGPFLALRGVDLTVDAGEFVAVIGKSGSGKSTLINTIAGIDHPTSGEVHVAGTEVQKLDENAMAGWRGANLGVIFQFFQLLPTLTLLENVVLPMEFARRGTTRERQDRGLALLERVGMAEHADKLPSAVSGGQQQRVAIARALANDPALIVADEPTGSLDSRTADTIFQLFEELVDQGKTILMVTHDNDLASRASRVVLIVDGEVVESYVRSALAGVSERDLADVSARLEPQVLSAGSIVFEQGDEADRFYIVIRGSLDVVRTRGDGSRDVIAVLGPGQYFGEIALLQGKPRNSTIRVTQGSDASVLALDADIFRRLVADNALAQDAIAMVMRQRMTAETVHQVLPPSQDARVNDIAGQLERFSYAPGDTILGSGDSMTRFFVVTEGAVDVMSDTGEETSYRYRTGRHFGAAGHSNAGVSISTLRAASDEPDGTTVAAIPMELHDEIATETGLPSEHIALLVAEANGR
jgi:ABC-type lipoprotein export system ATPase subunit/CRP-like cAMP-binding protein